MRWRRLVWKRTLNFTNIDWNWDWAHIKVYWVVITSNFYPKILWMMCWRTNTELKEEKDTFMKSTQCVQARTWAHALYNDVYILCIWVSLRFGLFPLFLSRCSDVCAYIVAVGWFTYKRPHYSYILNSYERVESDIERIFRMCVSAWYEQKSKPSILMLYNAQLPKQERWIYWTNGIYTRQCTNYIQA